MLSQERLKVEVKLNVLGSHGYSATTCCFYCYLLLPYLKITCAKRKITPATPTCFQSCIRGYHDKPKNTGRHVNEWLEPNIDCGLLRPHELERSWQTFNFPGLSGTVGKPFSEKVPSWGCRVLKKKKKNVQENLKERTSHFPQVLCWFRVIISLRSKIMAQWEGECRSCAGKEPVAVLQEWNFLI